MIKLNDQNYKLIKIYEAGDQNWTVESEEIKILA